MLDSFWFDLKHATRILTRTPRETAIAIAILSIGIGANAAMFSAIKSVVLQPLPFRDPDRLIRLRDSMTSADGQVHAVNMSSRDVLAVQARATVFDGVAAFSGENLTMLGVDRAERVSVVFQSAGALHVVGAPAPALGRHFTSEEERDGLESGVALVSYTFWQTRLGGTPDVLGTSVRLGGRSTAIVGVMPPDYAFPYDAQFWLPFVIDPDDRARDFAVLARMRPGVTIDQARSALARVAADVRQTFPDAAHTYGIEVMTIRQNLVGQQDAPLRALAAIVIVLLLIACVNVATMLLARAVGRRREFAVRQALGASRARHARQMLSESVLLTLAGCASGLLVTAWVGPLTSTLFPRVLSGQLGVKAPALDWRVFVFAVAASLASAVIAAIVPAFGAWTRSPQAVLVDGNRTLSAAPHGRRLLGALVVVETLLTLVLLAGAGLVIRHFIRLESEPLGFDARGLLTVEVAPSQTAYDGPRRTELMRAIIEKIRAVPGALDAAATTVNPLGGGTWAAPTITEDAAARDPEAVFNVNHRLVTPGLFEAMKIPLLRGRTFTEQDADGRQPVAVISDRLAQRFWPARDPIGQRIRIARPNTQWQTVIGVVGDVSDSHDPGVPSETWYLPLAQNATSPAAEKFNLMIRTGGDPLALVPDVQRAVAAVDKTLPAYGAVAMDAYRSDTLRRERASAAFMLGFGAFGLALAALGVYGVMAFTVAHRTAEIGLRIALGAQRRDIVPLVLRRGVALVAIGSMAGLGIAGAVNRALSSVLAEAPGVDGIVLIGAAALILAVSAVACLVPALGAARLEPIAALKTE
jgi:putative ABC transport system permease protein